MDINPFNYSLDFQTSILQFVVSEPKEGAKYLVLLQTELFDLGETQVLCEILQKYLEKYGVVPAVDTNLLEFFRMELTKLSVSEQVRKLIEEQIRSLFNPLKSDTPIIKEAIIEFARYKRATNAVKFHAPKFKEGAASIERLELELRKARLLTTEEIEGNKNHGKFLIAGYRDRESFLSHFGEPTNIPSLNRLTSARGFHTPQLITFLGAPKSFKTGFMINLVKGYILDGKKVYYADGENGWRAITNRLKQSFLECTYGELAEGTFGHDLDSMIPKMGARGGEFICDHYPAYTMTINDVAARLKELDYEPDLIVYDSLDHFLPIDSSIKENRFKSRAVYFDAIRLNNTLGCFCFTPSQVNRLAVNKAIINMKDFAEDFSKAMNAHAGFAICRTEDDLSDGFARLVPVMQREGEPPKAGKEITLVINAEKQLVYEPDYAIDSLLKKRWVAEENKDSLFDNM